MILLTVGTSFPFDRLVVAVDELVARGVITDTVFAQVGEGGYRPQHMEHCEVLDKRRFDDYVDRADALISHAGMGTITQALQHGKPLLAMPRRKRHGELVNDHQVETARKFEALGHILVAYEPDGLEAGVTALRDFVPKPRVAHPEDVAARIARFLRELG